jgi:hypothetical protein
MTTWLGGMWASITYRKEGQTKAVVFDVQKVSCVENQKEDWVITPTCACLSQKTSTVQLIGAGLSSSSATKRRLLACPCLCGGLF